MGLHATPETTDEREHGQGPLHAAAHGFQGLLLAAQPPQHHSLGPTASALSLPFTNLSPLIRRYLWMTGRVNMKAVECTIQNLIGSGMDPRTENNPYLGFVFTSFQERATKVHLPKHFPQRAPRIHRHSRSLRSLILPHLSN